MKIAQIHYQPSPLKELQERADNITRYAALAAEFGQGAQGTELLSDIKSALDAYLVRFANLAQNPPSDSDEPENLSAIRSRRPNGRRRLVDDLPIDYINRLRGSILGRGAGCTLGAAVEFHSVEYMEAWAKYFGDVYPPTDYFQRVPDPDRHRYIVGQMKDLTRGQMSFVPADDDTAYTLIGLLTMEAHGPDFTPQQQAEVWRRNFTLTSPENGSWGVYWGERKLLQNLESGVAVPDAGYRNNPNVQSIAAWTRADSWGYLAPGWPEKAAEFAYCDASINHRRNGVYGCMFFAAAISAAFVVDDPVEALRIGLQEIPDGCLLAEGIKWALEIAPQIPSYKEAARLVRERYAGMFEGHAVNNALFVVFGILIGRRDFTKVIGETMAMGFDNDCTTATAGSIVGAVVKEEGIPNHWIEPFQDRLQTYLKDLPQMVEMKDLVRRYEEQARVVSKLKT
ncbi:hypothetical protein B7463_g83, partial [Scytalidium lignicola]